MIRRALQWLWARLGRAPSTAFPERRVYFEISAPVIGDEYFVREVYKALREKADEFFADRSDRFFQTSHLESSSGVTVASNGVVIRWTASSME